MRERNQSSEDYLEAIYFLHQTAEKVHSVDVVRYLNFSKSSVSAAVNLLCDKGFLNMEKGGALELTEAGTREARGVYEKHCVIRELLEICGVDPAVAEQDACRMEHALSRESFEKLRQFYDRYRQGHGAESDDSKDGG